MPLRLHVVDRKDGGLRGQVGHQHRAADEEQPAAVGRFEQHAGATVHPTALDQMLVAPAFRKLASQHEDDDDDGQRRDIKPAPAGPERGEHRGLENRPEAGAEGAGQRQDAEAEASAFGRQLLGGHGPRDGDLHGHERTGEELCDDEDAHVRGDCGSG